MQESQNLAKGKPSYERSKAETKLKTRTTKINIPGKQLLSLFYISLHNGFNLILTSLLQIEKMLF